MLPLETIAHQTASTCNIDTDEVLAKLTMYANESRITLALILPYLSKKQRILEIGAGLCFTSLFLKSEGFQITALEPAIGGFDIFDQLKSSILAKFESLQLNMLSIPAQELNPAEHGYFDLIFSNNVIEHIPHWHDALTAMSSVLSAHGTMRHACPNYSVPYEPHYGIPVFRVAPQLSKRLFLSKTADLDIWNSLNFITCSQVKQFCKSRHLTCHFEGELLYNALRRVDDDPLFSERHQGIVATLARFIMRSGLGKIIRRIPPSMATPMIFNIHHQRKIS